MDDFYLGIDPGKSGGAVIISKSGAIHRTASFSKLKSDWPKGLIDILDEFSEKKLTIGIELVHSMPRQGLSSTFEFGRVFGFCLGILTSRGFDYQLLSPSVWQKLAWDRGPDDLWVAKYRDDPKGRSKVSAFLYWSKKPFAGPKGGIDDGLIDAALIARALKILSMTRDDVVVEEERLDKIYAMKQDKVKAKALVKKKREVREKMKKIKIEGKIKDPINIDNDEVDDGEEEG